MGKLCKRLGDFVPGEYEDGRVEFGMPKIEPEPVSPAHLEDWKEYRAERESALVRQPEPPRPDALSGLKKRHLQERKRLARRLGGKPLSVLNPARHELALKHREERLALTASRPQSSPRPGYRRPSFKSWLKAHGRNRQADRWRYRNRPFPATPLPPPPPSVINSSEALAAYAAHWEVLHKRNVRLAALAAGMALFSKVPSTPPEPSSRLDARIALLMRAEGHSRETVTDAIRRSAPELRQEEKRDWPRYAARTAAYAFGFAGDLELTRMPQSQPMEPKPVESPPTPKPHGNEAWRERPRLRMR